jgi:hypothetical protein
LALRVATATPDVLVVLYKIQQLLRTLTSKEISSEFLTFSKSSEVLPVDLLGIKAIGNKATLVWNSILQTVVS